ncbi:MAG TPA: UDP-N-acetylglucosamine 1-carboxyvinyltransferase [Phycisphaerae bacterium]|nr:UDP-N-acetylglucosamine 1-carboxyvinyltransferase [Phycisphaerae bacterium]
MDQFHIEGGRRLRGEVMIGGAKNAALPIMAASLLTDQPCRIDSVPDLADVAHLTVLLEELGVRVQREQGALSLQTADESNSHARYDMVRKMRASVCVLGPLLAKRRSARVAMPGGCAIGPRPIDIHLRGLRALGAEIHLAEGDIVARADGGLKGAEVFLGGPFGSTVTGTANVMMAAVLATGTSVIECAACEPEIQDLAKCLNGMGAKISGAGTPRLVIEGVDSLGGAAHTVIPDRIEAGTFMIASAITNGEIRLSRARLDHMMAVVATLRQVGVIVEKSDGGAVVSSSRHLLPADVTTQPYPGFPTDLQAQLMALLCLAKGNSVIVEKIYPDRFLHVAELGRMGADIRKEGPTAIVSGVSQLVGAPVMASDLRASAAMVLAALAAEGRTIVQRVYHIDRGYERIERKLQALGAEIERVSV